MNGIGGTHFGGTPVFDDIGRAISSQGAAALKALGALGKLPPIELSALTSGKAADSASLVSDTNGAPRLGDITIRFSPDDLIDTLVALQSKVQEAQLALAKNGLDTRSRKVNEQTQRNLAKIKDWAAKCESAAGKAKARGILGWFKKVLAPVAALVAVCVLSSVTGPAAGVLFVLACGSLLASCATLASDIAYATGEKEVGDVLAWGRFADLSATVGALSSEALKGLGVDKDKAEMIGGIIAVVTTIALAICTYKVAAGPQVATRGNEAGTMIEMASLGGSTAAPTAAATEAAATGAAAASRLDAYVKILQPAVAGIQGMVQAGHGGLTISVAVDERAASRLQADKKEIAALIVMLQQQMEEDRADIKKVMEEVMECMQVVSQMINAAHANRAQITAHITGKGPTA